MAILKCKMCGGDLDINESSFVAECQFCGAKQTVPSVSDANIANLFNRATTLRKMCEFDKAENIYEKIVELAPNESEAYWGLILCKFGIEYVEDPATLNRVPTCHRTSYDAISIDPNYKNALKYANVVQKPIYEAEAKQIDDIQKGILTLARDEEPYDIFICYKEKGADGKRTQDSVLANNIYHELVEEGYKVFYAAITLEDKLGTAYEPYIFAALNSAKVMLVVGTRPEYFSAVWVKNEWSRFLKLMKTDRKKTLIPCYKNMDAYELPEEFAHLQALDMGEIGFINTIEKACARIIGSKATAPAPQKQVVETKTVSANVANLIKRMFIFLEDGDFKAADEYADKILDEDVECGEAYLGKLMIALRVKVKDELCKQENGFDNEPMYQKIMRFGSSALKKEIEGYNNQSKADHLEELYTEALSLEEENTAESFEAAANIYNEIASYKDSMERAASCQEKYKEALYSEAQLLAESDSKQALERACELFTSILNYKDSKEKCEYCKNQAVYIIAVRKALTVSTKKDILDTIALFESIGNFKDSYLQAKQLKNRIVQIDAQAEISKKRNEIKSLQEKIQNLNKEISTCQEAIDLLGKKVRFIWSTVLCLLIAIFGGLCIAIEVEELLPVALILIVVLGILSIVSLFKARNASNDFSDIADGWTKDDLNSFIEKNEREIDVLLKSIQKLKDEIQALNSKY